MSGDLKKITSEQFLNYAGQSLLHWQLLEGQSICHPKFGDGNVAAIDGKGDKIMMLIRFENEPDRAALRKFDAQLAVKICGQLLLPKHLAEMVLRHKAPGIMPGSQRSSITPKKVATHSASGQNTPDKEKTSTTFQSKTLVMRSFALLSLHELKQLVAVRPILRHIRTNNYLKCTVYHDEMKGVMQGLVSAGYVYKAGWGHSITDKGRVYLRDHCQELPDDLLTTAGWHRLGQFSRDYDKQLPTGSKPGNEPRAADLERSRKTDDHLAKPESEVKQPKDEKTGQTTPMKEDKKDIPESKFGVSDKVCVRDHLNETGVVIEPPFYSQGEWHYKVFFSAQSQRIMREGDLVPIKTTIQWVRLEELLRNLALIKLQNPLSNNLYALYASRTQFEVYQFRPALKFLGNPDQRLLIADEVGLGKTIEAGIIYLELQARLDLTRVLVVCPSGLRVKWQDEMKLRFDEEFEVLDAGRVRQFIDRYEQVGGNQRLRGIVSLQLLRRPEFIEKIEQLPILFDLVVIDEAHHCRNTATRSNALATVLSDNSDAMLLLTATPLQMGNEDLFNLLRILSPGEFDNVNVFLDRLVPNQYINRAAQILATGDHQLALVELKNVERTRERRRFTGNPYYVEVVQTLSEPVLTQEQMITAQRRLVDLNTLANIFTRTRKREIAEKVPTRDAYILTVEFSPAEEKFYNRIIRHVREEFAAKYGSGFAAGWATIMYERQAASCISAARQRFANLAQEMSMTWEEQSFLDQAVVGELDDQESPAGMSNRRTWYRRVSRQTRDLQVDTKFDIFWETLQGVLNEDDSSKIIVFAFFRGTIEYLYNKLRRLGVEVEYLHGGIKVSNRSAVIDQFRQDPKIRVLISSDVGSEGLDFQFCNTIFNYDLPWNPMKVEQRIGRIDRFGQKSPKIRVYNLVIDNSIESRILMRLYNRIGIFKRAIGDIEAILGEQIREISKRVYSAELTPREQESLADQAAQNIIRKNQEMEEFERQRLQFMGQEAIFSTLVKQTIESGNYMSDIEMQGLVETFVRDVFPRAHLDRNKPADGTFCLEMDHDLADYIRRFIFGKRRYDNTAREFLGSLDPDKALPLTFSSEMASERKLLHFITPRHPLALAAADYWQERVSLARSVPYIGLQSDELRPGEYYFFIFLLESLGVESSRRLVPVAIVAENGDVYTELSHRLLHLVQTSAFSPEGPIPQVAQNQIDEAEQAATIYMTIRRDQMEQEIRRSNEALVNARTTAVTQSYEAKRRRIEEQLVKLRDERIIRMRRGQLRNMRARFEAAADEIDKQRVVSVSFSTVLRGYLTLVANEQQVAIS